MKPTEESSVMERSKRQGHSPTRLAGSSNLTVDVCPRSWNLKQCPVLKFSCSVGVTLMLDLSTFTGLSLASWHTEVLPLASDLMDSMALS